MSITEEIVTRKQQVQSQIAGDDWIALHGPLAHAQGPQRNLQLPPTAEDVEPEDGMVVVSRRHNETIGGHSLIMASLVASSFSNSQNNSLSMKYLFLLWYRCMPHRYLAVSLLLPYIPQSVRLPSSFICLISWICEFRLATDLSGEQERNLQDRCRSLIY